MSVTKLLNEPNQRIKELERLLERQQLVIDRMRKASRVSFGKARSKNIKGGFLRVIYGDVHGCYMEPDAIAAFLADVEELKPRELICVGDLLTCDGFLAEHHVLGVVPQLDYTYEEDTAKTNEFLNRLAKVSGSVPHRYIEGNHEARIVRQICKMTIRNPRDARFLEKMYGPAAVLSLDKRGIEFIRRHNYYDGLGVSGTIKLDPHAVAQHGEAFCGVNATRTLLQNLGRNVFHGHTHRLKTEYGENMENKLVGVNTGCLCQHRPLYGLTKTTGWVHGYAVQFCVPGQGFLAVTVPIIDGVSFLGPLLRLFK